MVKVGGPPLTQSEREKAADAAGIIVTRCPMEPNDGFVGAEEMMEHLQRRKTRQSLAEIDDVLTVRIFSV